MYRLDAQQTKAFNINAMSLNKSTGTSVGTVTDNRAESLKTLDATEVVKSITTAYTASTVIFQLGGAAAGGFLIRKGHSQSSNIPALPFSVTTQRMLF